MYTSADYVVAEENREAYESVCGLADRACGNVAICGPRQSGKTHLLAVGKERAGKKALLVPTAAIMLRFDLDLDGDFFDTLGEIPVLFVDEVEAAADHPETAKLLELMIAERNRKGLATCFATRKMPDELGMAELQDSMAGFRVIDIASFGRESLKDAIDVLEKDYSVDNGRSFSDDAREYLASSSDSLDEIKNKTRYLLQIADVENGTIFDAAAVRAYTE